MAHTANKPHDSNAQAKMYLKAVDFPQRQPCSHQRNGKFTLHKLTYISSLLGKIHFLFWLIQISFLWNQNSQDSCQLIPICVVLEQSGLRGLWYKNSALLKYIYEIDFSSPPPVGEKWCATCIDMLYYTIIPKPPRREDTMRVHLLCAYNNR